MAASLKVSELNALTSVAASDLILISDVDASASKKTTLTQLEGSISLANLGTKTLGNLTDVDLTGVANGNILVYNSTTSQFEPGVRIAGTVEVQQNTSDANFYPTFVNSNNASATQEDLYTDSGISYNPSTDILTVGTIDPTTLKIGSTTVTSTAAEINVLDGITASTAELNILDGVTATAAEINKLDGTSAVTSDFNKLASVTSTAAELNVLDGITSSTAELNILTGVTSTAAELNILDGVTSTAAELNILDGVTATAAEINVLDGVTAFVDEDNMASDSATSIPSQQSVKAYVDSAASTASAAATANEDHIDNLVTLTGLSKDSTHLGTFTGSTISDNSDIQGALQDLESAVDNALGGGAAATSVATIRTATDASHFIAFVTDNNASSTQENIYTDAGISYNPSSNLLTAGNITVSGNLTVSGTTTTIDTANLTVEDKNVIIGNVETPSDTTADGGGITLKGATDKTFNWVDSTDAWTSSEHIDLASGKALYIDGASTVTATGLGAAVVSSSLTSVGTLSSLTVSGVTDLNGFVDVDQDKLRIASTAVTATAAEINKLDGVTATTTELNYVDVTAIGQSQAAKALTACALGTHTFGTSGGDEYFDIACHDLVDGGLKLAGVLVTASAAEINKLDGTSASTSDFDKLAGITASAAEINTLDGITASTAELNILDGVTSTAAELNILDGVTSTAAELNILDGVTSTAAEINLLDGVTATTAEINYVDGVTSNIQTQLDAKTADGDNVNVLVGNTTADDEPTNYYFLVVNAADGSIKAVDKTFVEVEG